MNPATGFDGTPYPTGWDQDQVDDYEAWLDRERDYLESVAS